MDNSIKSSVFKRIADYITFINHPIRKKFVLFALGVVFWFAVMYAVSVSTLIYINGKSDAIVNDLIPHDRTAQKIIRKLHKVSSDADAMMRLTDPAALEHENESIMGRLRDVRSFFTALTAGGPVNDYDRESGKLLESYTVAPVRGDAAAERYVAESSALIGAAEKKLNELVALRLQELKKNTVAGGNVKAGLTEFETIVAQAVTLSHRFSLASYTAYSTNSGDIAQGVRCTLATATIVLLLSGSLLVLFTIWISRSIYKPVNSIIEQLHSLAEGDIDLTRKIEVVSRDEIGALSTEFNGLMENIHAINLFKKVIEEDESLDDVYSRLGNVFEKKFGFDEYMIYEVSNSQSKMRPVYPLITADRGILCNPEILDNCFLCRAKKTGARVSSLAYAQVCKYFLPGQDKEYICIPMLVGGSTGGVVQFTFNRARMNNADVKGLDRRLYKAEQYIKESISVIEAKRLTNTLKDSSLKDALTGLYNRRFLQEYTEKMVAGVTRRGRNIGLLMCDLDYYKQVNDIYGHNTGDSVLKETAKIIQASVRTADIVIRFGGEEFLVVLLDINEGDSRLIAEKIRESIENAKIKVPDGILRKTISVGISEFPTDADSFWQAIKFANVAMYEAKETGRNKSVRFSREMWKQDQF